MLSSYGNQMNSDKSFLLRFLDYEDLIHESGHFKPEFPKVKESVSQPEKTDDISRRHQRFPREKSSEKRARKFHRWRFTIQIWVVLLIELCNAC